ncbi:MAG: hypothetical protein K0R43_272 [Pseudoduganella sp.]|jgi:GNAT superfamily N-acetyltransferase|nr:hypothetical protein [Pseudoduganella sp.]
MNDTPGTKFSLVLVDKLPFKELKAFHEDAGWEAPRLPKQSRGQVQWAVVAVAGSKAAIARLELARPEFCFVTNLAVLGKYRGRGVGGWLLEQIEQHCRQQGIRRLILEPAPGTEAYYQSHHFIPDPLVPSCVKKELPPLLRRRFVP